MTVDERIALAWLRELLGDAPYVDIDHGTAVVLGVVRREDEHRGPARITRSFVYPDTTPRTRRLGTPTPAPSPPPR